MQPDPRQWLLQLFQHGLVAVNGRACVHAYLAGRHFDGPLYLVALGKAADAMTAGALDAIGNQLSSGLVVTRYGHQDSAAYRDPRIVLLEAGHPLPDEESLSAGRALQLFLHEAPDNACFLFLISGGASSLAEVPAAGVTLANLRSLGRWLLASGLPIAAVNRVRSAYSLIKGGRLLQNLAGREAEVLLISDVPGDVPEHIGSGPLLPPLPGPFPELPEQFHSLHRQPEAQGFDVSRVHVHLLATNQQARRLVHDAACAGSDPVHLHADLPASRAIECGQEIARYLCGAAPGVHIWGGETVVCLPEHPGRGGRNQHLALAAACKLVGRNDIWLLAAGTDGTDGNSSDAGAVVDGGSVARGEQAGFDAAECQERADAGSFLEASGDLVYTGPTGTNVMDLVIAYKSAGRAV
ncbi:MAG: glycerate kinase type-2 family protein [Gammaproteobacteria bacterium]